MYLSIASLNVGFCTAFVLRPRPGLRLVSSRASGLFSGFSFMLWSFLPSAAPAARQAGQHGEAAKLN